MGGNADCGCYLLDLSLFFSPQKLLSVYFLYAVGYFLFTLDCFTFIRASLLPEFVSLLRSSRSVGGPDIDCGLELALEVWQLLG